MLLQAARLEFSPDGTPFSSTYGDVYHAAQGGPAQARHVFLGGNQLPQRWQGKDRFVILETGFGLGLNFLATWQAWRADPQHCRRLHFISFEKHPLTAADLQMAQQAWPEFAELAIELRAKWPPLTPGVHRLHLAGGQVILTLFFGDACTQLRAVDAAVDAFFLDGFSPAKNPELWSPALCRSLTRLSSFGTTLATWSVAGRLREALKAAEFDLEKRPGFAGKRQMLVGHFRSQRPNRHPAPTERRALIIGAGIAGCTTAHRLASAGWEITLLEASTAAAQGASSNIAGMFRPLPSTDDNRISRLTRAGFLATLALLRDLPEARWSACGVLHLGRDAEHEAQQKRCVASLQLPPEIVQFVDAETASQQLGQPLATGGWWFPSGGWVQPSSVCRAALAAFPERITVRFNCAVDRLEKVENNWHALGKDGEILAAAPILIMASGVAATQFSQFAWLGQIAARGQVSHIPSTALPPLETVVCRHGYSIPAIDGLRLAGATHTYDDHDPAIRFSDHQENLAQLERTLPGSSARINPAQLSGRVGFRPMSTDRLPIVGPVPETSEMLGKGNFLPRQRGLIPSSLWCVQGFGARGIVWSALMADLLLSRLEGEPLPLENDLVKALDPARFLPPRK
jgi:tRNA 5-methylaminomethyl-2-thiouridine biosynthesis bifunctional protein